jgi:sortase B
MAGEVMFGEIPYFLKEDQFESHTSGVLFTPEHTYYIQWFACMETNAYDAMMYDPTDYTDGESMAELLEYIKSASVRYRDIGVSDGDRIIALSTCAESATDGRVILVGRLS